MVCSGRQLKGKILILEIGDKRVLPFVTDEVRQVVKGLASMVYFVVGKLPYKRKHVLILYWHVFDQLLELRGWVWVGLSQVRQLNVLIHDRAEFLGDPFLHVLNRMMRGDSEAHDVGGVPLLVELQKALSNARLLE